jgi:hypothetical protein
VKLHPFARGIRNDGSRLFFVGGSSSPQIVVAEPTGRVFDPIRLPARFRYHHFMPCAVALATFYVSMIFATPATATHFLRNAVAIVLVSPVPKMDTPAVIKYCRVLLRVRTQHELHHALQVSRHYIYSRAASFATLYSRAASFATITRAHAGTRRPTIWGISSHADHDLSANRHIRVD